MSLLKEVNSRIVGQDVRGKEFMMCRVGEVYTVYYLMVGGEKMRKFTGVCISKRRKGLNSSVTLRNILSGIGIEYTFNVYSGRIIELEKVERERKKSRRAKLYNLRDKGTKLSRV